jgi:hypothetical protein
MNEVSDLPQAPATFDRAGIKRLYGVPLHPRIRDIVVRY